MPTLLPRINVTLSQPAAAVLRRLSELTGNSQSRLIGEMVQEALPVLERMCQVLAAADKAKLVMRTNSAERLQAAQSKVEAQLGLVLEGFDEYTGSLLSDVEAVHRRERRSGGQARAARPGVAPIEASATPGKRAGRGSVTPPSNRGVRSVDNSNRKGKTR
jgi:hypothetical protein